MTTRLAGLTGATLETAPAVCQSCVWWQSRGNCEPEKRKWVERAEALALVDDVDFRRSIGARQR